MTNEKIITQHDRANPTDNDDTNNQLLSDVGINEDMSTSDNSQEQNSVETTDTDRILRQAKLDTTGKTSNILQESVALIGGSLLPEKLFDDKIDSDLSATDANDLTKSKGNRTSSAVTKKKQWKWNAIRLIWPKIQIEKK